MPELYKVTTNNKSILHVELGHAHLIEGSHSAKLWVYRGLTEQAIVRDPTKKNVTYSDLTSNLANQMRDEYGQDLLVDNITHYPALNWQKKAVEALNIAGVSINAKDVLTDADYFKYKRKFGVA